MYIEGDGQAWHSRTELSSDPTPSNPIGLKLAVLDPHPNIVYLARPCQYSSLRTDALCKDPAYWSGKRFSEEVIVSMNEAIDHFAAKVPSAKILLTGYSGGAGVAALIAARRPDVALLRTVAGNLHSQGVSDHHRVSPLEGSLDPLDAAKSLSHLPQVHFVGTRDKVIPPSIAEDFKRSSGRTDCVQIVPVDGAEHAKGWEKEWPRLLEHRPVC